MKNLKMAILFTMLVSLSLVAVVTASQITATKTTNPAAPNTYHVGDTIHYVMTVSNPAGNLATNILSDIHDHLPNGTIHSFVPPDPALVQAPGASTTYLLDYLVALADVTFTPAVPAIPGVFDGIPAHRAVIDEFHALGVDTLSDAVTATVQRNSFIVFPCIDVNKTVDPTVAIPGEEVTYTYTICNCGDVNLTLTAVDDNVLGDLISFVPAAGLVLNGGVYNAQGQLQAGECTTFTVPYTVQEGDPDPLCNLVTVTGVDFIGGPAGTVTDTDPACLDLVEPNIMIVKECNEFSKVGDVIDYDVTITNTGSTDLQILSVNDTVAGPQSGCVGNILAPAGTCSFSYKHTVVQGDPDPLINTVTVIGKAVGVDVNVTDSTTCETQLVHPDLTVTKACLTDPISGAVAEFRITITNTGDVNLIITTNEPEIPGPNTLPPGGTIVADVNRLVPAGAADVNNTVNVTATLPAEFGLSNVLTRSATATCTAPSAEGCTPGFWKNSTACWCDAYQPTDLLGSVFTIPCGPVYGTGANCLGNKTLLQALSFQGGSTVKEKAQILLRACGLGIAERLLRKR